MTTLFDVDGRRPTSYFVGGSAVYAITRDFNVLVEALAERNESVNEERRIERERSLTLSPGARYALNLPAGQLVVGAAAQIKLTREEKPDSFEHKISR